MKDLDKIYGERIIDTPVSENAVTGAAGCISLRDKANSCSPKDGFYALRHGSYINQAAKWSYMFGGKLVLN